MNAESLARIQFALTAGFHYLYPPMSIGLGLLLVIMEGMYLRTGNPLYHKMTYFWVKVFALTFGVGVATGIVMEFQFGTNWSVYSRYVGDVFGSALAAEGIFAFFLESGFLAVLVFGWNKVSKGFHFFSACMVSLGSMFSAVWIIVANSWQQTPAGHHIVEHGDQMRAEIVDFWAMVFNPSTIDRLTHTVVGCFLTGAFLVISVSAYYLLKERHLDFAKASMKIALGFAIVCSLLQLWLGHDSSIGVYQNQPTKFAAMEGHVDSAKPLDLTIFGWTDDRGEAQGLKVPGFGSALLFGDPTKPVTGLDKFRDEHRPPVAPTFQSFHIMVAVGMTLIGISLVAGWLWWRDKLWTHKLMLRVLVLAVVLPHIGNMTGWMTAEIGRQPWVVYPSKVTIPESGFAQVSSDALLTAHGVSPNVDAWQILTSIIMFTSVYLLLFALFVFLLDRRIKGGPDLEEQEALLKSYEKVRPAKGPNV